MLSPNLTKLRAAHGAVRAISTLTRLDAAMIATGVESSSPEYETTETVIRRSFIHALAYVANIGPWSGAEVLRQAADLAESNVRHGLRADGTDRGAE